MNFGRYDDTDTLSPFWAVLILLILAAAALCALVTIVNWLR